MSTAHPRLFSPLQIGPLTLRNRIVLSAMTTGFGYGAGAPTPDLLDYFRARSHGVGLATVAFGAVLPEGRVEQAIPWMWRPDIAAVLAPLTGAIHDKGAAACLQLGHGGRQVSPKVTGAVPVAPSPVPPSVHVEVTPHELATAEVEEVVDAFGAAATRAAEAGFDAVEIHAAHGYLIQQFLSPASNRRHDRFGEDRTRFGVEVVKAVRRSAPHLAIVVRVNGADLVEGGLEVGDAVEAASAFAAAGADAVLVSAGVYGSVPYTIPLLDDPEGCFLDLAASVRERVPVPVIGVGRITTPATAEHALASGRCDAVAVGRALLADPDWVEKAATGREAEIRPCIATVQGCAGMLQFGEPISCAVNPEVGREGRSVPPHLPRRVLVVGGGPAGMEAARRGAELGHEVVLVERGPRLGGQLLWAAETPPLRHLSRLVAWYEHELDRLGVEVVFWTDERTAGEGFDDVVVATGAEVDIPALDGFDLLPAWTGAGIVAGADATTGATGLPDRAVVAGSGSRALATALWLAAAGAAVTVAGGPRWAADTSGLTRRALVTRCDRAGIVRVDGALRRIEPDGVVLDGDRLVPCDGLVLVEPLHPVGAGVTGEAVGDARRPADIPTAIAEGRQAAEAVGA